MTNNDVEVMAPDGDTILIVGAVKHKFRVSSKRLSETSSVFKALFGPHFREGQKERSASSPVEIDLPDDYWRSMRRIFNMLHGCPSTEQGSTWLSGEVLEFAISVDKYDLIGALRFGISAIFSRWFQDRSACPNIRVLGQIVAAAYLLEDSKAFGLGTRQIIRMSTDRVMNLHSEKCSEILPAFVFGEFEGNDIPLEDSS
ncbi:hypothetical protein HII31_01068 [Pseudocercospora fuligena]|uniref:BTB domain-containing protein n=1 Tax=Pseudocercospora fuligena TaxID=685502 RepID=A0A8H6RTD1_9PEZI|nr:hypothetical protein HII31_01068 [Pseudocercospora fuligena]